MSAYEDARTALAAALVDTRTTYVKPSEVQALVLALTDALNDSCNLIIANASGALRFIGLWDASTGLFPGDTGRKIGWFYKVSVAGTADGVSFSVGDEIFAIADNAATATYAGNWLKLEGGLTLAEVESAVGFTFGSLAALSSVTASLISDASANGRSLITAASYAAMRSALGLGTAATANTGTADGNVVAVQTGGKLPALDASNLTNVPVGAIASQAEAEAGTDATKSMPALRVSQAIAARRTSYRNIVGRNAGMEVWQRGTSVAVAASTTAYTADGWYLATGANQASTVSRVAGLTDSSVYAAQVARNAGQTGTGIMRWSFALDTDEVYKLRNKATVLSFSVKAGANWSPTSGTLSYALYVGTGAVAKRSGSAYTGETTPITGSVNLTPGGAAQTVISAITSALPTNITCAELQFSWTPTGTAGANDWFSLDDMQVEVVPTGVTAVTPVFERSDYGTDLSCCMRHLSVWRMAWSGVPGSGVTCSANASFPPMRASPTVTVTSQTNSARFPAANFGFTDVSTTSVTAQYISASAGGNEAWFAQGLASAEI